MDEIASFNSLFADAANKRFKVESFRQDDHGFFYACWRTADNIVGPELKRRLPFNAALDAYVALRDRNGPADEPAVENDLFG